MELADIVQLFVNNGVAIAVIIYFMFRDYKFISELQASVQQLIDIISDLKHIVDNDRK